MSRSRHLTAVLLAALLAGCLEGRERAASRHEDNCTTCHGSRRRPGTPLQRSAPPVSLDGRTSNRRDGVGAHLQHVMANEVHAGVPCATCHEVPEETDSPGHADTALPAEVLFAGLALADEATPHYAAGSCSDVYCHGERRVDWSPSETPQARCERCHAMPPAAPHPASDDCAVCHGDVIDGTGRIIAPSRHVDGVVDVDEGCDNCHGTGELGAPPPGLSGATSPSVRGVGAHQLHLEGSGRARRLSCDECHTVPSAAGDEGHLDPPPAEVRLSGVATTNARTPRWDRDAQRCADSWCHGPSAEHASSPAWTSQIGGDCTSCHGMPPPAPHPQMEACALCHAEVIDPSGTIVAPSAHVDGTVNVDAPVACNGCHGDATSPAPPRDLLGNTAPSFPGVGAHRAHVEGSVNSRPVPCEECHAVPSSLLDPGHVDTFGPAELRFSGVARSFTSSPSYADGTCSDTYCHGAVFPFGHPSGATTPIPSWTSVTAGPLPCDACHGLPPPAPHPPGPAFCSDCHPTAGQLLNIIHPLRHVDGRVDLSP